MELLDRTNRLKVHMVSKERTVNASNDFISGLDRLGLAFKLN